MILGRFMMINYVNAWREILTRTLDGFAVEHNVSPDWLVNPATKRPLKLDLLYPEIGLAIRFSGLRGSQRRRSRGLPEKARQRLRDSARSDLCEAHGVSLADLQMVKSEPHELFSELELAMSRATRRLDKSETVPPTEKSTLLERLKRARGELRMLSRTIKTEQDLNIYLDLWHDRQFREGEADTPPSPPTTALPALTPGMAVEHSHFGPGIIQTITPGSDEDDTLIKIRFADNEERTFMAGLLADKLKVQP
jgi:hypothetical protein